MQIFLWIMFGLSLFGVSSSCMSVTRASDFITGMLLLAMSGFGLIVYYAVT